MKRTENKLMCESLHEELIDHDPWGDVEGLSFIGRVVFNEWLTVDEENVAVYEFKVELLIDDFIDNYTRHDTRKFPKCSEEKANIIIADLKRMIVKIEMRFEEPETT